MNRQYIDLSHPIQTGMITYKGLPAPIICDYMSRRESEAFYEDGTSFQIDRIDMLGNTGTYIDSPYHRYDDGKDLAGLALPQLVDLPAVLIQVAYQDMIEIGVRHFSDQEVAQKAVLIHTGWSEHWASDRYFENHPFLTEAAAHYLKDQHVKLVGIDSHNIDDTRGRSRPVHTILLDAEILIVEHMTNLGQLHGRTFTFSAVPPRIERVGSFPVRAFATIQP